MTSRINPTSPCPVHPCALEWYIASQAVIAAISFYIVNDPRMETGQFNFGWISFHMNAISWSVWLLIIGFSQMVALFMAPSSPNAVQRWASGIACFSWSAFALGLFHGGLIKFAFGQAILCALGQLYVCTLLRGARWRS